jgi:hypothetical protein
MHQNLPRLINKVYCCAEKEKETKKRKRSRKEKKQEKKGSKNVGEKENKRIERMDKPKSKKAASNVGLRPRAVPIKLIETMGVMSKAQKAAVRKMGFGKILSLKVNGIPSQLGLFVVENFNPKTMSIEMGDKKIKVDEESINQLLGLPNAGVNLKSVARTKKFQGIQKEWRDLYGGKYVLPSQTAERIRQNPKDCSRLMQIDFVALFLSSVIERQKMGYCKIDFLHHLDDEMWIENINWCEHIVSRIEKCKDGWQRGKWFAGAVTVLMVISKHIKI